MNVIRLVLSLGIVLLLFYNPIAAMEQENYSHSTFVIDVRRSSEQDAEHISKAITYFLGSDSPELHALIKSRVKGSYKLSEDLRSAPLDLDFHSLASSDDQIRSYVEIKKLIGDCVNEALKTKDQDAVDYQLQLSLKEKEVALANKKLYFAIATSGLSLAGIVVTFLTTYFAKE